MFEERYDIVSRPLFNFPTSELSPSTNLPRNSKNLKIGYFGSLDVRMNQRCIEEICKVVDGLNARDCSVSLDIYTRKMY